MANINRTKRTIKRHERDLFQLKRKHEVVVNQIATERAQKARTIIDLENQIKVIQLEADKKIDLWMEEKEGIVASMRSTSAHIDLLKLLVADEEAGEEKEETPEPPAGPIDFSSLKPTVVEPFPTENKEGHG